MNKKLILFLTVGFFSAAYTFTYSLENIGSTEFIWIEVENADEISPLLEIYDNSECSGGKGIRSLLPSHKMEAFAKYKINILKEGEYTLWIRAFWPGACSNSYQVIVGNSALERFGNDNILESWHWVKGKKYFFTKGEHNLFIWNDEFDARIDKILFSGQESFYPVGLGNTSNINITFEEIKFLNKYLTTSEDWSYSIDPLTENTSFYINPLEYGTEFLKFNEQLQSFALNFKYMEGIKNNGDFFIKFNYKDELNYSLLAMDRERLILSSLQNGKFTIIKNIKFKGRFPDYNFKIFSLIQHNFNLIIDIDGNNIATLTDTKANFGNISIGSNSGDLYLDDIKVISDLSPIYSNNFFWADQNSDEWERIKPKSTDWTLDRTKGWSMKGEAIENSPAIFPIGENYWSNYSITCAINSSEVEKEYGICFYHLNDDNYYLVKCLNKFSDDSTGTIQVIKVENGVGKTLKEVDVNLNNSWNRFDIQSHDGIFALYLNKGKILELSDRSFIRGKVAFLNYLPTSVFFDDLVVQPSTNTELKRDNILDYSFEIRNSSSLDISDWNTTPKSLFKDDIWDLYNVSSYVYIDKPLFKEAVLENVFSFAGNFSTEIHLKDSLSPEMNINFLFKAENKKEGVDSYKVQLKKDSIFFLKNERLLIAKVNNRLRKNISVSYKESNWVVNSNDNVVLAYSDTSSILRTKIGLVFEGVESRKIICNSIRIQSDSIIYND